MNGQRYRVFLYPSVRYVLKAEKILKDQKLIINGFPFPGTFARIAAFLSGSGRKCRKQ